MTDWKWGRQCVRPVVKHGNDHVLDHEACQEWVTSAASSSQLLRLVTFHRDLDCDLHPSAALTLEPLNGCDAPVRFWKGSRVELEAARKRARAMTMIKMMTLIAKRKMLTMGGVFWLQISKQQICHVFLSQSLQSQTVVVPIACVAAHVVPPLCRLVMGMRPRVQRAAQVVPPLCRLMRPNLSLVENLVPPSVPFSTMDGLDSDGPKPPKSHHKL